MALYDEGAYLFD